MLRMSADMEETRQRHVLVVLTTVGLPLALLLVFWPLIRWYCSTVEAPRLPGWYALYLTALYGLYLYRLYLSRILQEKGGSVLAIWRRLCFLTGIAAVALVVALGAHLLVGLHTYSLFWANSVAAAGSLGILWFGMGLALPRGDSPLFVRGRHLLTLDEARAETTGERGIPWGGLLVPVEDANTHFSIVGAPGSGKTVTIRAIMQAVLPQLGETECHGALIYDPKHDVVAALAGMGLTVAGGQVAILNPFDRRHAAWDMAADITTPDAALEIATILSPLEEHSASPFFSQTARDMVTQIIETFIKLAPGRWDLRDVLIACSHEKSLRHVLSQTAEGQALLDVHSQVPVTWSNIQGTLSTKLRPYRVIAALWHQTPRKVSLESWFAGGKIIVLGSSERSGAALRAINRVLFLRLTQIALDRDEDQSRRRWFFIDEARDAGNLEGLPALLTKGRSKGMCVVLGFQDTEGMKATYGENQAMSLIGQCDQRAVLRIGSTQTAEWAAAVLGEVELDERTRTQNHGNLFHWWGTSSTTVHREKRAILLPSETMALQAPDGIYGPEGVFLTRRVGPYRSRLRWEQLDLPVPDPNVAGFEPFGEEAVADLGLWDDEDEERLGLCATPTDPVPPDRRQRSQAGPDRPPEPGRLDDVTQDLLR